MRNNKGFSLVELIVAFAIFAIVGATICAFVVFGSKNYSSSNKEVKLQYEQQIAVNQIRDIVLETSEAISYDSTGHELLVFGKDDIDPAKPYSVSSITFDVDNSTLNYNSEHFATFDGVTSVAFSGTPKLLAEDVTDFSVDLKKLKKGQVTLNITFKIDEKEITVHPVIKLRNKIKDVTGKKLEDIYDDDDEELTSNVLNVIIYKGEKQFNQGETDTIGLAGSTTATAIYTAKVNKKSFYEGNIDQSVTWTFGTAEQMSKYGAYISCNNGSVKVDVTKATSSVRTKIQNETFVLTATSVADPNKSAKVKVRIVPNGIYPKKLTTPAPKEIKDYENGLLKYKFTHTIDYTDGSSVSGDKVYELITYSVTPLGDIAAGCGFDEKIMDGVFICNKSMENKTFKVVTTVKQQGKDGIIKTETTLKVGKVPDKTEQSKMQISYDETANRADYCTVSVAWTHGVPTYGTGSDVTNYFIKYKFEVEKGDCDKWNSNKNRNFDKIVNIKATENWQTVYKKNFTSNVGNNKALVYCEPYLDWNETFTYRVKITPYVSKTQNGQFEEYKIDGESQTVTKTVVINPVEVYLTPATDSVKLYDSAKKELNYIISYSSQIGTGNSKNVRNYAKIFKPVFTGITVNATNVQQYWDGNYDGIATDNQWSVRSISGVSHYVPVGYPNAWQKILQPYYFKGAVETRVTDMDDFHTDVINYHNTIYIALKMNNTNNWTNKWGTVPAGAVYAPYIDGQYEKNNWTDWNNRFDKNITKPVFKYREGYKDVTENNKKVTKKYYLPEDYDVETNPGGYKNISNVLTSSEMKYSFVTYKTAD